MKAIETTDKMTGSLVVPGGQILFDEHDTTSTYRVLAGEVLILRNGQALDLVEAGELLDAGMWHGATAVAWTDCVLQTIKTQPLIPSLHTLTTVLDRHLALAA